VASTIHTDKQSAIASAEQGQYQQRSEATVQARRVLQRGCNTPDCQCSHPHDAPLRLKSHHSTTRHVVSSASHRRYCRPPLLGKKALVTGASRGIGAAIACVFAAAGADVAFSDSASPDKAVEIVRSIQAAGQKAYASKADHAVQSEVTALVSEAHKLLGDLDILAHNARVLVAGNVTDDSSRTADFAKTVDRLFAIDVTSIATAVRAAAPLLPKGGCIINVGSGFGQAVPVIGGTDYAATSDPLSLRMCAQRPSLDLIQSSHF
jgi:short-subunit dehydrogenase involved in D-alanine esterification of teichoic acids